MSLKRLENDIGEITFEKEKLQESETPDTPSDENDSFKDVVEYQNNMYNVGHYIGTGRVPPHVSATGNPMPLAVLYFIFGALFLAFGLFLLLSDAHVTSGGLIKSPLANKIVAFITMTAISAFFAYVAFVYLKKAKKYYSEKAKLERAPLDESVEDKLWQRTCPNCEISHDIDYPRCPECNFNYRE